MRVRTYRGPEKDTLLKTIHEECGEQAEILSTRERRRGGQTEVVIEVGLGGGRTTLNKSNLPAEYGQIQVLREILKRQGVSSSIIDGIARAAQFSADSEPLSAVLRNSIADLLEFDSHLNSTKRFNLIIGPNGSGKTNAIAGIAARIRDNQEFKVGLISADGFSSSSAVHLQTYAKLYDCPYRMLPTGVSLKEEMPRVMEYFTDCDLVLIDTPGVDGTAPIPAVVRYLAGLEEVSSTLIVPASASSRYTAALSAMVQELKISRVAISQVDLAFTVGSALNALVALSKPLAFITDGAGAVDHAHPANPEMLVDLLMRDIH